MISKRAPIGWAAWVFLISLGLVTGQVAADAGTNSALGLARSLLHERRPDFRRYLSYTEELAPNGPEYVYEMLGVVAEALRHRRGDVVATLVDGLQTVPTRPRPDPFFADRPNLREPLIERFRMVTKNLGFNPGRQKQLRRFFVALNLATIEDFAPALYYVLHEDAAEFLDPVFQGLDQNERGEVDGLAWQVRTNFPDSTLGWLLLARQGQTTQAELPHILDILLSQRALSQAVHSENSRLSSLYVAAERMTREFFHAHREAKAELDEAQRRFVAEHPSLTDEQNTLLNTYVSRLREPSRLRWGDSIFLIGEEDSPDVGSTARPGITPKSPAPTPTWLKKTAQLGKRASAEAEAKRKKEAEAKRKEERAREAEFKRDAGAKRKAEARRTKELKARALTPDPLAPGVSGAPTTSVPSPRLASNAPPSHANFFTPPPPPLPPELGEPLPPRPERNAENKRALELAERLLGALSPEATKSVIGEWQTLNPGGPHYVNGLFVLIRRAESRHRFETRKILVGWLLKVLPTLDRAELLLAPDVGGALTRDFRQFLRSFTGGSPTKLESARQFARLRLTSIDDLILLNELMLQHPAWDLAEDYEVALAWTKRKDQRAFADRLRVKRNLVAPVTWILLYKYDLYLDGDLPAVTGAEHHLGKTAGEGSGTLRLVTSIGAKLGKRLSQNDAAARAARAHLCALAFKPSAP